MCPTGHVDRNTRFLFLDNNMKFLENSNLILNLYNWNCSRDFSEPTLKLLQLTHCIGNLLKKKYFGYSFLFFNF